MNACQNDGIIDIPCMQLTFQNDSIIDDEALTACNANTSTKCAQGYTGVWTQNGCGTGTIESERLRAAARRIEAWCLTRCALYTM